MTYVSPTPANVPTPAPNWYRPGMDLSQLSNQRYFNVVGLSREGQLTPGGLAPHVSGGTRGNALDDMISQSGGGQGSVRGSQYSASPGGGAPSGSFFSAAGPVTAGANSSGSSPFGTLVPDLSRATPEQLKYIMSTLSGLTYNLPAGGYMSSGGGYGNTVFGPRGYYNRSVALPSGPQNQASDLFNLIGSFPTKPMGTQALNALPGYNASQHPSYNTQLGGSYSGPYGFPNWRNNG